MSKRRVWETELLLEISFSVRPDIPAIVTFLFAVPTGETKSAPKDLSPFFRSSNKYELTRPDNVFTPITILSSPGTNESIEIFFEEFCVIRTVLGSSNPFGV